MSVETNPKPDAPIGELVAQLSAQLSRLVRDEMMLAQKEIQQSARHAGKGLGLLGTAGLLALCGVASLLAAAIAAIALLLPVWAAALIVGAAVLAASGITVLLGKKQADEVTPTAPQTVANVKKDLQQVKDARHDQT
jgi:Putative Actinobacterial Holin-X, holin superfamily III